GVGGLAPVDPARGRAVRNGLPHPRRHSRFLVEKALGRLRERYSVTADQIVDFLYESPAFTVRFRGVIKLGVEAYLAGDHPKAISLLVPQIENALLCLLPLVGRPPSQANRRDPPRMTEQPL